MQFENFLKEKYVNNMRQSALKMILSKQFLKLMLLNKTNIQSITVCKTMASVLDLTSFGIQEEGKTHFKLF